MIYLSLIHPVNHFGHYAPYRHIHKNTFTLTHTQADRQAGSRQAYNQTHRQTH